MGGYTRRADLHGAGSSALRTARRAAVDAWVQAEGYVCPGYQVPRHEAHNLTADHIVSVALGGDPAGPFAVLCRSCNGRKGKGGHAQVIAPVLRSRDWFDWS